MNRSVYTVIGILVLSFILLLGACGTTPNRGDSLATKLTDSQYVKSQLYSQHENWRGTRYKLGGLNKKGVDCSGFVYLTYKKRFGISLPRNTESQASIGKIISPRKLRPGDLVFFKTGWKTRHVGIYIEKGKFLHASTSRGVIISNMNNRYWKRTYWKSVRLSI